MVVSSITSHRVRTEFKSPSQLGPFRVQSSLCMCGFPLHTLSSSYSPKACTLGYLVFLHWPQLWLWVGMVVFLFVLAPWKTCLLSCLTTTPEVDAWLLLTFLTIPTSSISPYDISKVIYQIFITWVYSEQSISLDQAAILMFWNKSLRHRHYCTSLQNELSTLCKLSCALWVCSHLTRVLQKKADMMTIYLSISWN